MSAGENSSTPDSGGDELYYSDDAVHGWRANNVIVDAGRTRAWLIGVHHSRRYGVHATAACTSEDHHPPATGCHCGMHAWPDRDSAERYRAKWMQSALCEVELEGEIVCHGDSEGVEGYRASHMTTLGVEFSAACWQCGAQATALRAVPVTNMLQVHIGTPGGACFLQPACQRCAGKEALGCADVAALLGTEVRFGESLDQPGRMARWLQRMGASPTPFNMLPILVSLMCLFGLMGAVLAGSGALALIFCALGLALTFTVSAQLRGRRVGPIVALLALLTGVALAVMPAVEVAREMQTDALAEVSTLLEAPIADGSLSDALGAVGAADVMIVDVGEYHKAVSFTASGTCVQVGLDREGDSWRKAGLVTTGVIQGVCRPVYVPAERDATQGVSAG